MTKTRKRRKTMRKRRGGGKGRLQNYVSNEVECQLEPKSFLEYQKQNPFRGFFLPFLEDTTVLDGVGCSWFFSLCKLKKERNRLAFFCEAFYKQLYISLIAKSTRRENRARIFYESYKRRWEIKFQAKRIIGFPISVYNFVKLVARECRVP